jgi:hypothetical protein
MRRGSSPLAERLVGMPSRETACEEFAVEGWGRSCGWIGFPFDQKWFIGGQIGFIDAGSWRFCAAPGEGRGEKSPSFSGPDELAALRRARGLRQITRARRGCRRFTAAVIHHIPGHVPVFS